MWSLKWSVWDGKKKKNKERRSKNMVSVINDEMEKDKYKENGRKFMGWVGLV